MSDDLTMTLDLPDFVRQTPIIDFLRAWDIWRSGALLPRRGQVRLVDLPSLMSGAMILDMFALDRMIFRFAGSLYHDMYGFDFDGLNYLDITDKDVRDIRAKRLWGVVSHPAAAVWTAPGAEGVDFVGASVPLLPDDEAGVHKILQVLVPLKDLAGVSRKSWDLPREKVTFSNRFRYLDIGAGKPDTSVEA